MLDDDARRLVRLAMTSVALTILMGCGARAGLDRDGVVDPSDLCRDAREDPNGVDDGDGCPETTQGDRDGDHVADSVDRCVDDPEDVDGFDDTDGCADPDNDADGVADRADRCPCEAEDVDSFADDDGCPDPDDDGDHIADACDLCPHEAETYDGACDEDGCPDRARVCVAPSFVITVQRVTFTRNSAQIREAPQALLAIIQTTLTSSPELRHIRIVGHAELHERRPIALSLARAETVRAALVTLGLPSERLEVTGGPPALATEELGDERYVHFEIVDDADPRVQGQLFFSVAPNDACGPPRCRPVPACATPAPLRPVC